jgi:hypothetical protein
VHAQFRVCTILLGHQIRSGLCLVNYPSYGVEASPKPSTAPTTTTPTSTPPSSDRPPKKKTRLIAGCAAGGVAALILFGLILGFCHLRCGRHTTDTSTPVPIDRDVMQPYIYPEPYPISPSTGRSSPFVTPPHGQFDPRVPSSSQIVSPVHSPEFDPYADWQYNTNSPAVPYTRQSRLSDGQLYPH